MSERIFDAHRAFERSTNDARSPLTDVRIYQVLNCGIDRNELNNVLAIGGKNLGPITTTTSRADKFVENPHILTW
jgi:ABC-type transport system substrate-binding protein